MGGRLEKTFMERGMMTISQREQMILGAVVDAYVESGEPVGSRTISKTGLGISAATIRNTMSDLEEKGLVYQPHTSAGRIPTDQGYRYYVDRLMSSGTLMEAQSDKVRAQVMEHIREGNVEDILDQISRVIADVSHHLGLVLSPRFEQGAFRRLELVSLTDRRILLVLSIQSGLVKTMAIEVDSPVDPAQLSETVQALNERLSGLTVGELKKTAYERLQEVRRGDPKLLRLIADETVAMCSQSHGEDLHLGGAGNIFLEPEFRDRQALVGIVNVLEARNPIVGVLESRTEQDGVAITIGNENRSVPEIQSCSVVTSRYRIGTASGVVGVIGPTRMHYLRVSSLVRFVARLTEELVGEKG
ncbi:MAG: heat-inducible transcription repressor HrcA [Candidatus Latescibacteria bacterium]|nr:heat-inducible transcription repressor HrcA [Candidatus Latescibacterota bacterium]